MHRVQTFATESEKVWTFEMEYLKELELHKIMTCNHSSNIYAIAKDFLDAVFGALSLLLVCILHASAIFMTIMLIFPAAWSFLDV